MSGHIMQRSEIDTNFTMIDDEITAAKHIPPRHVAIFFDEDYGHIATHAMDAIFRRPGFDAAHKYINSVWPVGAVECRVFDNDSMPPVLSTKIIRKPQAVNDGFNSRRMLRGKDW